MNTNQSLIKKIKKLLALSKSSNQHEAEMALQKATALMEEHQIQQHQLKEQELITHSDLVYTVKQHFIWAKYLAGACAKMFDCKTINYPQDYGFRFLGEPHQIQCAILLFEHLFKAWKTICNQDYTEDKPADRQMYRKSHGLGFANVIYARVIALTEKRQQNIVLSTGTDLVVVSDSNVKAYMESNFKTYQPKERALTTSSSGLIKGKVAGYSVNLNQPLETKNDQLLR